MSKVVIWKPAKNAFRVLSDKPVPGNHIVHKTARRRMRRCATYACSAAAEKAARAMNLADPGGSYIVVDFSHCVPRNKLAKIQS